MNNHLLGRAWWRFARTMYVLYCRRVKFHFARLVSSVFRRLVAALYFTEQHLTVSARALPYELGLHFPGFHEYLFGLLYITLSDYFFMFKDYLLAKILSGLAYFCGAVALLSIFVSPSKSPRFTPSEIHVHPFKRHSQHIGYWTSS